MIDRATFSRSYGRNLPNSLARNNSSTLVYSTNPPVSVYGTVAKYSYIADFTLSLILKIALSRSPELCIAARILPTRRRETNNRTYQVVLAYYLHDHL